MTIVVGVDQSDGAAQALRWAVQEGGLRGWKVRAVMAWGLFDQHHPAGAGSFDPAYGEGDALDALDGIVRRVVGDEAAAGVERTVVCDLPARALLDASHQSELLVVGARGLGGFRGLLLGSVSQHCLHHTRVPLAVVRQPPPTGAKRQRIVVAVDGSPTAGRALLWALEEAVARDAAVTVVHAWSVPYVGASLYGPSRSGSELYAESSRLLLDEVVAAAGAPAGVRVEPVSAEGPPAGVILGAAEGADLLVMGSRGLGGLKGILLGSVTNQVAHHATCPLVVVPPSPDQAEA